MVVVVSFLPWRSFFNSNTSLKVDLTGTPHIEEHTRALWYLHQELDTITPQRVIIYHEGGVWFEVASPLYLGLQFSLSHFQSWESLLACTPCQPTMSFTSHGCCCFVLNDTIFLQGKHEFKGKFHKHATNWISYSTITVLALRNSKPSHLNEQDLYHEGGVWCEVACPLYLGLQFSLSSFPILRKPFGVHSMSTYSEL